MINYLVFLGPALATIIATGQILSKKSGQRNLLAANLLYCLACIHLITLLQFEGYFSNHPYLIGTQIPLLTLLGPLFYFFFMRVINPGYKPSRIHYTNFLPTLISPLILLPYLLLSGEEKQIIQLNYLSGKTHIWETFPNNLVLLIFTATLIYILLPLKTIFPLLRKNLIPNKKNIIIALGFILCFSINITCVIIYQFYDIDALKKAVSLYFTFWVIAVYFVNQAYPQFLTGVSENIVEATAKYKRSQLKNINTESIVDKLNDLMESEKVYLDDSLTLPVLAEKLSISTHQLSEVLNKNLNISFKDYIKRYRINEAKRLLIEDPSQTVLTISMEVGFRSPSTFHYAFKKETGLSPAEYRTSNTKK